MDKNKYVLRNSICQFFVIRLTNYKHKFKSEWKPYHLGCISGNEHMSVVWGSWLEVSGLNDVTLFLYFYTVISKKKIFSHFNLHPNPF
jgi:hypothetical protein